MKKANNKPSVIKMALKGIASLFFMFMWIYVVIFLIGYVKEEVYDHYNEDADNINRYDRYYYEKEYYELFGYMHLHSNYDEMYDHYWEVVDAYVNLSEYKKWCMVSAEDIADAREMEEMYRQKVLDAKNNCRFPQNQKYLDDFAESLGQ